MEIIFISWTVIRLKMVHINVVDYYFLMSTKRSIKKYTEAYHGRIKHNKYFK